MRKHFKTLLITATAAASTFAFYPSSVEASSSKVNVQIDHSLVAFPDELPFIDGNGFTQIPIRTVAEELGASVQYEKLSNSQNKVTLKKGNKTVVLKSGSTIALVDSKEVRMDTKIQIVGGRTFVPLRFINEAFGYTVKWNNPVRLAMISTDGKNYTAAVQASNSGTEIVNIARKYLGVKYVWGGSSPSTGFDCSGFVQYVFAQKGISLPHSSASMHKNYGTAVSKSNLKAGDLVFFITNNVSTSHVGIYIGNDQFISATSKGVTIASLSSSYWGPKYNGAKRVL